MSVFKHVCHFKNCVWAYVFNCSGGFPNDGLQNLRSVLGTLSKLESACCGKVSAHSIVLERWSLA